MTCTYCDKPKTRVYYNSYVCDSPECAVKAVQNCDLPNFANHGKTSFKSTPKFSANQERAWSEIAHATGFNQDGTMKTS